MSCKECVRAAVKKSEYIECVSILNSALIKGFYAAVNKML